MKLLYKYYRWRASRGTGDKVEYYRLKAYRVSAAGRLNYGRDLTGEEFPEAIKKEQTLRPPKSLNESDHTFSDRLHYSAGKYSAGRDNNGKLILKDTQAWWADTQEANQQHMPTRLTKSSHIIGWKFNKETGRREYITYNYQTGQQEKLD